MAVCPVDCFYRTDEGVVLHDKDICIGCGYCSYACPFGAPQFPTNGTFGLRGKMDKCTFCAGGPEANGSQAEYEKYGRNRLAEGKLPACAEMCSTKALLGGDGDVVADIFRNRVLNRGKGSEVWGWGTAYGKPTPGHARRRSAQRRRSHERHARVRSLAARLRSLLAPAARRCRRSRRRRAQVRHASLAEQRQAVTSRRAGRRATRRAGNAQLRDRAQGQNDYARASEPTARCAESPKTTFACRSSRRLASPARSGAAPRRRRGAETPRDPPAPAQPGVPTTAGADRAAAGDDGDDHDHGCPSRSPNDTNAQRAQAASRGNNAPFWRGVHDSGERAGLGQQPAGAARRGVLIQPITPYPGHARDDRRRGVAAAAQLVDHSLRRRCIVLIVVARGRALLLVQGADRRPRAATPAASSSASPTSSAPSTGRRRSRSRSSPSPALVMAFGKFLLLPIIGGPLFGWLTWALKTLHNFVGPLFAVSVVIMFITYLREQPAERARPHVAARAGGMLGGDEPPSRSLQRRREDRLLGRRASCSAPFVIVSGFVLDKIVPGLDLTRADMQVAHIVHADRVDAHHRDVHRPRLHRHDRHAAAPTRAMKTGYVDEGWAEEHHKLWYDDIAAGKIPAQRIAAVAAVPRERPAA